MIKQCFLIATLICFSLNQGLAQRKLQNLDEDKAAENKKQEETYGKSGKNWSERFVFGGNLGGGIGSNSTFLLVQPIIGYKLTETTITGAGATYIYSSFKFGGKQYSTSVYGPILFVRQNFLENFFAMAEYQPINYEYYDFLQNSSARTWYQQLNIGGGYGSIPGAYIAVLYNVLYDSKNQIFNNPLDIRVGFFF